MKDNLFWLLGDKQGDWMKTFLGEFLCLPTPTNTRLIFPPHVKERMGLYSS
jgi:hypothetical protein